MGVEVVVEVVWLSAVFETQSEKKLFSSSANTASESPGVTTQPL